jgi:hypothetical protein
MALETQLQGLFFTLSATMTLRLLANAPLLPCDFQMMQLVAHIMHFYL